MYVGSCDKHYKYNCKSLNVSNSASIQFDNRPVSPTNRKPAAKAAGFVFPAAGRTCSPRRTGKQNRSDEVGTRLPG